jgi:hypothetical protein
VATLSDISTRVRIELADLAQSFSEDHIGDGTSTVWNLSNYPLDATTLVVKVNGTQVAGTVSERDGRLVLSSAPALGSTITVTGTRYRYFSPTDLDMIVSSAVEQHIHARTDEYGRAITLSSMGSIEIYPASLLATVQALYALATDSSFDIDIHTPDGVSIPRSERFAQLMQMIQVRQDQYKELCTALNIGLYRIEVFTFRRISKSTGRYIPVFQPQEIDDYSTPLRVYLPMPSYGSTPAAQAHDVYDITLTKGDSFQVTLDFDFDLTDYTIAAQSRLVPESPVSVAFTVTVVNAIAGTVTLSLTSDQTDNLPFKSMWDVQLTSISDPTNIQTVLGGVLIANKGVTR